MTDREKGVAISEALRTCASSVTSCRDCLYNDGVSYCRDKLRMAAAEYIVSHLPEEGGQQ